MQKKRRALSIRDQFKCPNLSNISVGQVTSLLPFVADSQACRIAERL